MCGGVLQVGPTPSSAAAGLKCLGLTVRLGEGLSNTVAGGSGSPSLSATAPAALAQTGGLTASDIGELTLGRDTSKQIAEARQVSRAGTGEW